jgi:hypothetical protein
VRKGLKRRFVALYLSEDEITRVDQYRFLHRFPSRTAAVRFLLDYALTKKPPRPGRRAIEES